MIARANRYVGWWMLACSFCACTKVQAETPTDRNAVSVLTDLRYSDNDGKAGLCDVYMPAGSKDNARLPVIVVVHGGGWASGDKWTMEGYSRLLARGGFVVVNINYRLAPAYVFPSQVDDVRSALMWTKENADRFSIDTDRLGLFGYSAGGHLTALVASLADESIDDQATASEWSSADPRWKELPEIKAICIGGPPCEFRTLPLDNTTLAYFLGGSRREKPGVYVAASPAAHTSALDPVTQIIHGAGDLIVPIKTSHEFHAAQVSAGVDSRLEVIPGQGHMLTFLNPKTSQKVVEFFSDVLN